MLVWKLSCPSILLIVPHVRCSPRLGSEADASLDSTQIMDPDEYSEGAQVWSP